MEQRTNSWVVSVVDNVNGPAMSSWRSIGSVAAQLAARAEARLVERASPEDGHYVPVAWAAE